MSEERKKVLEMLAQGKITSEEAERLLQKLEPDPEEGARTGAGPSPSKAPSSPTYLRVIVDSPEGDKVNIRVPLALVRTGLKLTTMLPSDVNRKIGETGIDLSQLSELRGEELTKALEELTVDVDAADGTKVKVFCE